MAEAMDCPRCGCRAIKRDTNCQIATNPPMQCREWWCACGWTCGADPVQGETEEDRLHDDWRAAQGPDFKSKLDRVYIKDRPPRIPLSDPGDVKNWHVSRAGDPFEWTEP